MIKNEDITTLLDDVDKNRHEINKIQLNELKVNLHKLKNVKTNCLFKYFIISVIIFLLMSSIFGIMEFFDFFKGQHEDVTLLIISTCMLFFFLLIFSQFRFNKKLIAKIEKEVSEQEERIKFEINLNGGKFSIAEYVMSLANPISEEERRFQAFYLLNKEEYRGKFIDLANPSILDKDEMIMEIEKSNSLFNKAREILKS